MEWRTKQECEAWGLNIIIDIFLDTNLNTTTFDLNFNAIFNVIFNAIFCFFWAKDLYKMDWFFMDLPKIT